MIDPSGRPDARVLETWPESQRPMVRDALHTVARRAARHAAQDGREPTWPLVWSALVPMPGDLTARVRFSAAPHPAGWQEVGWQVTADSVQADSAHLALLRSVLNHTNDAIVVTEAEPVAGPGPRIVYVNDTFTRMTGYAPGDVIGRTPRILQGPLSDRSTLDRVSHALRHWEPVEVELVNYRKDGAPFWVQLSIAPVADETGWFTHWVAIQRDVTERHLSAQDHAQEQAQVLERAAQGAPLDTLLDDLLGRLRERLPGHQVSLLAPGEAPDEARSLREPLRGTLGQPLGTLVVTDARRLRPEQRLAAERSAHLASLLLEQQQTRQTLQRSHDETRAALQRSQVLAALGDALQDAPDAASVADATMKLLGPVLGARSMLTLLIEGGNGRLVAGWGQPVALTGESWPLAAEPALHAVATSGVGAYDTQVTLHQLEFAGLRCESCALEPVLGRSGEVIALLGAWRDPGPESWSDEQRDLLRRAARTLGLALNRAHDHDDLRRANDRLERSNIELERFAYVASHDLQAPIRAITSFAELLGRRASDSLDERSQKYLAQISASSTHMKRLVDGLLAYSQSPNQIRPAEWVDLGNVMEDVALYLQPNLAERGAQLAWQDLPTLGGDRALLHQLLQNLVGNGLKYQPAGRQPQVTVSAERQGDCWAVSVTDNGLGIAPQYQARVFGLFQRLHTQNEYEGTGLGLAICRRIVEAAGGHLTVRSAEGVGSTFTFTWPQDLGPRS